MSRSRWAGFSVDAVHLVVLANFAVAQPVYAVLGSGAEFFVARRAGAMEVALLVLGLGLGLPAIGILIEALAATLLGYRLRRAVHAVLVAAFAALLLLGATRDLDLLPGDMMLVDAAILGAAAAAAYLVWRPIRLVITVLAPAPALFAILFLLGSPVKYLLLPATLKPANAVNPTRPVPVVLVVFDEFSTTFLMDERGEIDRGRYPNLAAFARDATWYRAATTVSDSTVKAVPAVLTGRRPDLSALRLPTLEQHPENLFTLLGDSYSLVAFESITRLCPEHRCSHGAAPRGVGAAVSGLFSDVLIVFLHIVLPPDLRSGLPSVTQNWADFATEAEADPVVVFRRFVSAIDRTSAPVLYFAHVLLPHVPWRYLPSGRAYESRSAAMAMDGWQRGPDRWTADEWAVVQGLQRHLLQLGLVDTLVGELMGRLKVTGLYEEALVILTADHGVSFQPGETRRVLLPGNAHDIVGVPLLVKLPRQRGGAISDSDVETVDILPTVADVLGVSVPWTVDGRSLLGPARPYRREKVVVRSMNGTPVSVDASLRGRQRSHARMLELFGSGSTDRVLRPGRFRALLGRRLEEIEARAATPWLEVQLDDPVRWDEVDPTGPVVPVRVSGHVRSKGGPAPESLDLAIAVNGTIGTTTQAVRTVERDVLRFSAFVPETALRPGRNIVEVFTVQGTRERPALTAIRGTRAPVAQLERAEGGEVIVRGDGGRVPIRQGAAVGWVDGDFLAADGGLVLTGWAVDTRGPALPRSILVFVDGVLAYEGPTHVAREDVMKHYGVPGLRQSGFEVDVVLGRREKGVRPRVRVFALGKEAASELAYAAGYRWHASPAARDHQP